MRLDGLPSFSVCVNPHLITRAVTVPSLRLRLFTQIRVAGCVGSLWVIKRASVRLVQSTANLWFAPVWVLRNKLHLRCSSWCSWHSALHLQLHSPSQHGWTADMWRAGNARYRVRLQNFRSLFRSTYILFVVFFFRTPMSALTGSLLLSSSFRETYFRTTHCLPRSELIATPVSIHALFYNFTVQMFLKLPCYGVVRSYVVAYTALIMVLHVWDLVSKTVC